MPRGSQSPRAQLSCFGHRQKFCHLRVIPLTSSLLIDLQENVTPWVASLEVMGGELEVAKAVWIKLQLCAQGTV